jgi:branched-chain amino acid transport system substrate-binding protein
MELFQRTTKLVQKPILAPSIPRRQVLKLIGLSGAAALPFSAAACGAGPGSRPDRTLKIGLVAPRTGTLAAFSESDDYVIESVKRALEDGIKAGGSTWAVDIVVRDSQSDEARATEVTEALIEDENVSLVMAHSAPQTVLPVAKVCEERGATCLSSVVPWEQVANNVKNPKVSYHMYWGQGASYKVFIDMWESMASNKVVGSLWPDDASGATWSDRKRGFPAALQKAGYTLVNPGLIRPETNSFGPIIKRFQDNEVDIITGSLQPADFATFWRQADVAGYRPLIVTMSRALQSSTFVEAISPDPEGLSIAAGWTPSYGYNSSMTNQASRDLAQEYSDRTNKQWTQPVAFLHAMFEVAIDALERADDPTKPESVAAAIGKTNLATIVGQVDFDKGPAPHIATTPLVGAQWRKATKWPYELVIVHSATDGIPEEGELRPLR